MPKSKVIVCPKCDRVHYDDIDCPAEALTFEEAVKSARDKGRVVLNIQDIAEQTSGGAQARYDYLTGGPLLTNTDPPGYKAKVNEISERLRREAYLEGANNPRPAANTKPTVNPKDQCGVLKAPLSYVSWPVVYGMALGMCEGGYKYGAYNYRAAGVQASIYFDATLRHLTAWWEGQDYDPDSKAKLHHIDKAMASLHVLRDSIIQQNFVDDRPPRTPTGEHAGWLQHLNRMVEVLNEQYPNPVPRWTQKRMDQR